MDMIAVYMLLYMTYNNRWLRPNLCRCLGIHWDMNSIQSWLYVRLIGLIRHIQHNPFPGSMNLLDILHSLRNMHKNRNCWVFSDNIQDLLDTM